MRPFLRSTPLGWSKWRSKHKFMITKVKGITYMNFDIIQGWWHKNGWIMPHHQKWQLTTQPSSTCLCYSNAQVSSKIEFSIRRYGQQNPWTHKRSQYNTNGDGNTTSSTSIGRTSVIEQVYEKELERIDAYKPRTPYLFPPFQLDQMVQKMVRFTLSPWPI